jgi:hypothetical protein
MELRRQRHDDRIDISAGEQFVRRKRQTALLGGKALGARRIGVGDRVQRAERLQGTDVVAAPVSATEDCNARLSSGSFQGEIMPADIVPAPY